MGRTFLRQDAQIRNSVTYDDLIAAGSTMESSPTEIETDLNCLRSQVKRLLYSTATGNWYDDLASVGGAQRGVNALQTDLYDIEQKKLLFRAQVLTDITVPASAFAAGSITAIAGVDLNDGETFTISDGVNTPTVFEFDSGGGVTPGNVAVSFTSGDADTVVATAMRSAINGVTTTLLVTAAGSGASVTLTNDVAGSMGNVPITDTVANAGFVVSGMSGGAGDAVVLVQASSETPTEVAAVTGTQNGAVVAVLTTDVGRWDAAMVSGVNAINPKNLCLVRDAITDDPILSGGKQVYALIQAETGVVDGDSFNDTTKQVQLSFVRESTTNPHTLERVPPADIAGKDINYSYVRRINLDAIPEQSFLVGEFIDQAANVDVTLDNAIDNQSGPATQNQNIEWRITDTYTLKFQDSTGGANLIALAPNVAGDEVEFNVAVFDVNNSTDADFLNGAKFDTGGTEIDIGVNAGTIETTGSNDLTIKGAREVFFDDVNQTGSTWAQTGGIKLSDTTTEWDNFETAFGEVSLLNAIYQAWQNAAPRSKTVAVVTAATISAGTNVTGAGGTPNIDAQLGDYSAKTFLTDVDIYLNGQLLRNGANAGANHDVYPGTSAANGDLMFEFGLHGSPGNPDVITMIIW